ncbi:MAG: biotin synthase [Rhodobacter sp. CACIA14H1]|nr:MAG: biotin synthase [Rhodobacter sp. CACIA14H1]
MGRNETYFAEVALDRALAGHRLSGPEILSLFAADPGAVGAAAHEMRLRKVEPTLATFSIGGNIDHTNVCNVGCAFCTFYRAPGAADAYAMSPDQVLEQLHRQVAVADVKEVMIQGGINPKLSFDWFLTVLRRIKSDFPDMHVDFLSPEEIRGLERQTGRDARDIMTEFQANGMDGLPGASAEILVDRVRTDTAPLRITAGDWYRIVDTALELGLYVPWTSQVTGLGESHAERVQHLVELRALQDRDLDRGGRGIAAHKVWPMRLNDTRLREVIGVRRNDEIIEEYIQQVAIHRLALDNITHHRAVWRTMGYQTAARALRAGANDLCGTGSINAVDSVLETHAKEAPRVSQKVRHGVLTCIAEAGFVPAQRDAFYQVIRHHEPAEIAEARDALQVAEGDWMRGGFSYAGDPVLNPVAKVIRKRA